jgi:hypothetical protein
MYGMSERLTHVAYDPRDPVRPGTVGRPVGLLLVDLAGTWLLVVLWHEVASLRAF